MKKDTIAAISTGMQPAGIAVIRISGEDAVNIVDKIFKGPKPLKEAFSHSVNYGFIISDAEKIDEVLVVKMLAPHTFTGEDTIEINCHGSLLVQKKILSLLIENGAKPAGPGEFTMRAFMNGKMDLAQAESVMDIISAENELYLKNSIEQLSGNFSSLINDIREKLLYEVAYIESALDDPEHFSLDGYMNRLSIISEDIKSKIERMIDSYQYGEVLKTGINVAIIGKTNVGKSSLLNVLSGTDAAIVSNIPGTTRDSIEKRINLGSVVLNVIDTAGIRDSEDEIEKIGISRAKKHMDNAQLVLYVIDSSANLEEDDIEQIQGLINKDTIILLNKIDLCNSISTDDIKKYTNKTIIPISTKEIIGIDILKDKIENIYIQREFSDNNATFVSNERHFLLLKDALNSINLVNEAINMGMTEDILAIDLTDAYTALGKILGKEIEEDIINEIFSKFCIGK